MDTLKQAQLTIQVGCRTGETQIKPHYLVFLFFRIYGAALCPSVEFYDLFIPFYDLQLLIGHIS
jgi:hypothetical protein